MEKKTPPYYYPSEMYLQLKTTATASIKNDFNMIIEEYGFWEKCTAKDQKMIVDFLFKDILNSLD